MRVKGTVWGKCWEYVTLTLRAGSFRPSPFSCQPHTHSQLVVAAEVGGPPGTFLGLVKLIWVLCAESLADLRAFWEGSF